MAILLAANVFPNQLLEIPDPSSPTTAIVLGAFPSGLTDPRAAASLPGRLFVVDRGDRQLWEVTDLANPPGATFRGVFPSGLAFAAGACFHNGDLYIANNTPDELWRLLGTDLNTPANAVNLGSFPNSINQPFGITSHNGRLIVVDSDSDGLYEIPNPVIPGTVELLGSIPSSVANPVGLTSHEGTVFILEAFSLTEIPNIDSPGTGTERAFAAGIGSLQALVSYLLEPIEITPSPINGDLLGELVGSLALGQVPLPPLILTDFDQTDLQIDFLALIEAGLEITGDNRTYYADSNRPPVTGLLLDGELGVSSTETILSRLQYIFQGSNIGQIRLNDNDVPDALSWTSYFFGLGSNLTLYIQTADSLVSIPIADNIANSGGGYVRLSVPTAAGRAVLNSIEENDRFILVLARHQPIEITPIIIDGDLAGEVVAGVSLGQAPIVNPIQISPPIIDGELLGNITAILSLGQVPATPPIAVTPEIIDGDLLGEIVGSLALGQAAPIEIIPIPIDGGLLGESVGSLPLGAARPRSIGTRLRPVPSNNRYSYQVSPNRATPQLAPTSDVLISIPGKTASLGERIFPFSGLVISSGTPVSGARWRRDAGSWTDIFLVNFTDIVSAIRFYSEILNEYGEFIYDLDVSLDSGATPIVRAVSVTVQSKILLGLPKTTDVNVRYKPFSDAHIAIDKAQIRSIKYSAEGDAIINKTIIERPVLHSGEHDGSNNSLFLSSSVMDFTSLNIRLGKDILRNVTSGNESIITVVITTILATQGSIEWNSGDSYEILDGASLDIIARGFELSHSSSGLYILTLHVEDLASPSNESSASVSVVVD